MDQYIIKYWETQPDGFVKQKVVEVNVNGKGKHVKATKIFKKQHPNIKDSDIVSVGYV